MSFVKEWASGIVISIVIATLFEMLLPNNASKKYVKIVIGLFVVYNIIFPILDKFKGGSFEKSIETFSDSLQINEYKDNNYSSYKQSESITNLYKENLESSVRATLKSIGYEAGNITITVCDDGSYNIEKMSIEIIGKEECNEKQAGTVIDTIKCIKVSVSNESNERMSIITDKERDYIVSSIGEMYGIAVDSVRVYSS